jgi:hypothetical protein
MKSGVSAEGSPGKAGAALVEAALTLPLFCMILLFFVDLSRYFYISYTLEWAAHAAADTLAKDPRVLSDLTLRGSAQERQDYIDLLNEVIAQTKSITSLSVPASAAASASSRMVNVTMFDAADYPGSPSTSSAISPDFLSAAGDAILANADIAILRPGERAYFGAGVLRESSMHSSRGIRNYPSDGYGGWPRPELGETWDDLYKKHYIEVQLRAKVKFITPGFSAMPVEARAVAFAKKNQPGMGTQRQIVPELPTPTSTALATDTSTPAPGAETPGPTPTPLPTDTPPGNETGTPAPTATGASTAISTPTPTAAPADTPGATPTATSTATIAPQDCAAAASACVSSTCCWHVVAGPNKRCDQLLGCSKVSCTYDQPCFD